MKAKYNNLYKFLFLIFTMIGYSMTANANDCSRNFLRSQPRSEGSA